MKTVINQMNKIYVYRSTWIVLGHCGRHSQLDHRAFAVFLASCFLAMVFEPIDKK